MDHHSFVRERASSTIGTVGRLGRRGLVSLALDGETTGEMDATSLATNSMSARGTYRDGHRHPLRVETPRGAYGCWRRGRGGALETVPLSLLVYASFPVLAPALLLSLAVPHLTAGRRMALRKIAGWVMILSGRLQLCRVAEDSTLRN